MESFRYLGWTVKWEKDQRERGKIILIKGLNYKFFKLLRFVHNFSCSELWFIYVTKWLKFPARKLSTLGDPGNLMDFLTALHVTASNDARNIEWCHHLDDYPFRSWNPQMYNWSFTLCILPEIPLPLLVDTRSTHSPNSHLMFWAKKPETPYILVSKSRSRTRNSSPYVRGRVHSSLPSFLFSMSAEFPLTEKYDEKLNQAEGDESGLPEGVESFANSLEERALLRKLDKRILPLTCLLYLFACSSFLSFDSQKLIYVWFI